jgi:uncharacterized protein YecE (DUF72 family)
VPGSNGGVSLARGQGRRPSGRIRIGTSGWHYDSWWGPFFPQGLAKKEALPFYASRFDTTELNNPFYRTPTLEAVQGWADNTPDGFLFAWKASKFITHWKRLTERCDNSLELMETRLAVLGDKAGPVLFQLPPIMKANRERLAGFLRMLSGRHRYAFEFRDPSWYEAPILDLLREHDASLCLSDHAAAPAPWVATASWVYVRGHGPSGRYHGNYTDETLRSWADDARRWQAEGRDVFFYFDNDMKSAAPFDAQRLLDGLAEEPVTTQAPAAPRRAPGRGRPGGSSRPGPDSRAAPRSRGSSGR